jgi:hypothetical protein
LLKLRISATMVLSVGAPASIVVTTKTEIVPAWAAKGWTAGIWEADLELLRRIIWGVFCDHQRLKQAQGELLNEESKRTPMANPVLLSRRQSDSDIQKSAIGTLSRRVSDGNIRSRFSAGLPPELAMPLSTKSPAACLPSPREPTPVGRHECRYCGTVCANFIELADHLRCERHFSGCTEEEPEGGVIEFGAGVEMEYVEYADGADYEDDADCGRCEEVEFSLNRRRSRSSYSGYESPLEPIGESPEPEDDDE